MKIYKVIPITRGVSKEILTYFGPDSIPAGALVSVPLRRKSSLALVIESEGVVAARTKIRKSDFSLKKIGGVKTENFLSQTFMFAAQETSEWFATPLGATLNALLPKIIRDNAAKIRTGQFSPRSNSHEKLLIQADDEERFANYRSLIREEFARRSSVFFCAPTIEDIRRTRDLLTKGIEKYTAVFHSELGRREFRESISLLENEDHPLLIIATASFLCLCRSDVRVIVLDRENSRNFRTQSRPFIDLRRFVEKFARLSGARFIAGDIMLSAETIWRKDKEEFVEFSPLKFRPLSPARGMIIDMKTERGKFSSDFRVISPELETLIGETRETNSHLFIFSARKGLSPTTVCGDCGKVVLCNRCSSPVVLYSGKGDKENFFQCNRCGERRGAAERCVNCKSWKLTTLGIGIELVEQELKKLFPKIPTFSMDKERVSTPKKAVELISRFEETPGSVLIGTEMALNFLSSKLGACAVASIDSLLSVPDFRINERVLYLLVKMRSLSQKKFLIQTRNADAKIFDFVLRGNLIDFYREEIEERKKFLYPPFSVFIKVTAEGRKLAVEKEMEKLQKIFAEYEPRIFESLLPSPKGNFSKNMLLRVAPDDWPNHGLSDKIKALPPYFNVKVDPESLL